MTLFPFLPPLFYILIAVAEAEDASLFSGNIFLPFLSSFLGKLSKLLVFPSSYLVFPSSYRRNAFSNLLIISAKIVNEIRIFRRGGNSLLNKKNIVFLSR